MIFLEFEKPLASLYAQLEKLKEIAEAGDIDVSSQISVFEGSSWTWDDVRKEYYYHAFLDSQPDLNYRNPAVRAAMKVGKS